MWDRISQIGIAVLGSASISLFALGMPFWGFVVTLMAEPFWFYTSYINKQWGIFITAIWYTGWSILGIYREL